jgi:hypothetical protein
MNQDIEDLLGRALALTIAMNRHHVPLSSFQINKWLAKSYWLERDIRAALTELAEEERT